MIDQCKYQERNKREKRTWVLIAGLAWAACGLWREQRWGCPPSPVAEGAGRVGWGLRVEETGHACLQELVRPCGTAVTTAQGGRDALLGMDAAVSLEWFI